MVPPDRAVSLTRRTLARVAVLISLIVALATVAGYRQVRSGRALDDAMLAWVQESTRPVIEKRFAPEGVRRVVALELRRSERLGRAAEAGARANPTPQPPQPGERKVP